MRHMLAVAVLLVAATTAAANPLENPALQHLPLTVLPDTLAYCQRPSGTPIPSWATTAKGPKIYVEFADESSVLVKAAAAPSTADCIRDFRAIRLDPVVEDVTGIIATLSGVLARANVSVYVLSTRNTDYFMVHAPDLEHAIAVLKEAGHHISS